MVHSRRSCLKAFGAVAAAGARPGVMPLLAAQVSSKARSSKLGMPGLYRGRVVGPITESPRGASSAPPERRAFAVLSGWKRSPLDCPALVSGRFQPASPGVGRPVRTGPTKSATARREPV